MLVGLPQGVGGLAILFYFYLYKGYSNIKYTFWATLCIYLRKAHCHHTMPCALPHTATHCRTKPHALPHTAALLHTTALPHTRALPHSRTLPHYSTLPQCRTAWHCRAHFHTLPSALPHTVVCTATHCHAHCHILPRALPHIAAQPP